MAIIGGGTLNASSGGAVSIGAGNLATSSVNNIGASGSTIALTGAGVTGLIYTGAGETTNRIIGFNTASAGGVVTASGSGTVVFSNAATTTATAAFGVTFNGQGAGSFVGITQPGTPRLINFNKQGVGTWTLTGLNDLRTGAIRADGGVLNFAATSSTGSGAAAGTITRNATSGGVLNIANGAQVFTSTANTNSILGGWATFDNNTWAVTNGTGSAVTGLTSFTADAWAAGNNTDVSLAGADPVSGSTTNSLRFNEAGAKTLTLAGTNIITSGGLMVTSTVGANTTTITGGTLQGASNSDLIIHQNNAAGALTIASAITNNGTSTGLTKTGAGTVNFSTQKAYTGTTNVLGGVLNLSGGGGGAGVIRGTANVATGATLRLSTGDATGFATDATRLSTINLLGGTLNVNSTSNQTLGSAVVNMTGGAITGIANSNLDFFGGSSALNTLASGTTSTVSGVALSVLRQGSTTFTVAQGWTANGIDLDIQSVIRTSPSGNAANAVFIKAGAGTMALSGTNTISGATNSIRIDGGTLMVGNGGTTGDLSTLNVTNNSRLTFNRSNSASHSNIISGTGSLTQVGSGITILTAANTYAGGTTVSAGTLLVNGSHSGTGAYTVNGGTLGGTGSIAASITVAGGGTLSPGASVESLAVGGTTTLSAGSSFLYEVDSGQAGIADLLVSTGGLALGGATLQLNVLGTYEPGTKFTLINYGGSAVTSGFTGIADDSLVTASNGSLWLLDYNDTTAGSNFIGEQGQGAATNYVTITAQVPEPGVALLTGLGLLGLLRRRRVA